jgi:L-ascorbate metabolism protein UlaG (beta-lactamase superfamily)
MVVSPHEGRRPEHAVTPRYFNPSGIDVSPRGFTRWRLQRLARRLPRPPVDRLSTVTPALQFLHANRTDPTITWIGHSSLLMQLGGRNILIDPVFSERVSPARLAGPRRHQPPGLTATQLPHIDVVVISHDHYDHLDRPSVRAIQRQAGAPPTFLVPRGVDTWLARNVRGARPAGLRRNVFGLEWGESFAIATPTGELALHFLPVQHWSSRSGVSRNATPWGSWALVHPSLRFWYSGDLGYSDDPKRIGEQFGGFDFAAIAIGAYEPRWFMRSQHVNPAEAVQVMLDVGAAQAIGVHWGTFALADESLDQPPRDLAAALAQRGLPAERFTVMKHGETRRLKRAESVQIVG